MPRRVIYTLFFLFFVLALIFLMYFIFLAKFSKDTWIEKFKSEAPPRVCRLFFDKEKMKNILESNNISNEKCASLMSKSLNKCIPPYFTKIPSEITKSDARKWGAQIENCASKDFSDNYLSGESLNDSAPLW